MSWKETVKKLTFCSSWEPEYFAEMDFISPPNAEAHSFTLQTAHMHTGNGARNENVSLDKKKKKKLATS